MLVIRLQRTGRKNDPTYRIVVSEKSQHVKKGCLEVLGHYLPGLKAPVLSFEKERILHWVKMGAAPSNTVARVLTKNGVAGLEKFLVRYTKQKSKNAVEAAAPAATPAAAPEAAKA